MPTRSVDRKRYPSIQTQSLPRHETSATVAGRPPQRRSEEPSRVERRRGNADPRAGTRREHKLDLRRARAPGPQDSYRPKHHKSLQDSYNAPRRVNTEYTPRTGSYRDRAKPDRVEDVGRQMMHQRSQGDIRERFRASEAPSSPRDRSYSRKGPAQVLDSRGRGSRETETSAGGTRATGLDDHDADAQYNAPSDTVEIKALHDTAATSAASPGHKIQPEASVRSAEKSTKPLGPSISNLDEGTRRPDPPDADVASPHDQPRNDRKSADTQQPIEPSIAARTTTEVQKPLPTSEPDNAADGAAELPKVLLPLTTDGDAGSVGRSVATLVEPGDGPGEPQTSIITLIPPPESQASGSLAVQSTLSNTDSAAVWIDEAPPTLPRSETLRRPRQSPLRHAARRASYHGGPPRIEKRMFEWYVNVVDYRNKAFIVRICCQIACYWYCDMVRIRSDIHTSPSGPVMHFTAEFRCSRTKMWFNVHVYCETMIEKTARGLRHIATGRMLSAAEAGTQTNPQFFAAEAWSSTKERAWVKNTKEDVEELPEHERRVRQVEFIRR